MVFFTCLICFLHFLLLGLIGQQSNASCESIPSLLAFWTCQHFFLLFSYQSYASYVSIFFFWPSLHCDTCFRACFWWKRFFHAWSCYRTIPWLNNIQMITWLNFDAYIPHLDSPLIILASFGCPWCGPSCFILAFLHIILFLNPVNGIPNDTSCFYLRNLLLKIPS